MWHSYLWAILTHACRVWRYCSFATNTLNKRETFKAEWLRYVQQFNIQQFYVLPSAGKVMCTVFWDRKGVILLDFLEPGQTINSDRYIATLTKLKARISRVRPEKKTTFLLQNDNARPHTSLKTVEHFANLGWTVLTHPPYSLDLAPSDFHLFGTMKDGLRGLATTPSYEV